MHRTIVTGDHADQLVGAKRAKSSYDYIFVLTEKDGWQQMDTPHDSQSFGIWINPQANHIFAFDRGQRILFIAYTKHGFEQEVQRLASMFGAERSRDHDFLEVHVDNEMTFRFPTNPQLVAAFA